MRAIPLAKFVTPLMPTVCTGEDRQPHVGSPDVPSPTSPPPAEPHAHNVPSERRARLFQPPPATATAPVMLLRTGLGCTTRSSVPLPSSPKLLTPHDQVEPSVVSATGSNAPAEIAVTPLRPMTWTG